MKGGFKNALPWIILLTLVLISVGVSMVVIEGLEMKKEEKEEDEEEKEKNERMKSMINLVE
jgi:flagellar basal body-associated protein FliL